jgi:hypothetical protein
MAMPKPAATAESVKNPKASAFPAAGASAAIAIVDNANTNSAVNNPTFFDIEITSIKGLSKL